jgi:hypothetical protein
MATGVAEVEAKRDICHAINDKKIKVRIYFVISPTNVERRSRRALSPREVRYLNGDQIPEGLEPGDFDWSQSRVRKPWEEVRSPSGSVLGHWQLIERSHYKRDDALPKSLTSPKRRPRIAYLHRVDLFRDDVTNILIAARTQRRGSPALERAHRALNAVYSGDIPDQATEPNKKLCARVNDKLEEWKLPSVSNDTSLRAAGRRK